MQVVCFCALTRSYEINGVFESGRRDEIHSENTD
jgi:hypothetical protein